MKAVVPSGSHRTGGKQLELLREGATSRNEGRKPLSRKVIGGRVAKRVYLEDANEVCFQDIDGCFYHFDLATNMLTELPTRDIDVEGPIPPEAWSAFGALLAMTILRKERAAKKPDVSPTDGEQHG